MRHIGRLLDGNVGSRPDEVVKDGDLVLLIGMILQMRGRDTVRISKVKGHATMMHRACRRWNEHEARHRAQMCRCMAKTSEVSVEVLQRATK